MWRAFAGGHSRFERTCSEQEWLSRGKLPLVLHEAVLAGQVEATGKLVLTGFDRITPAQQDLIEAFRERGYEVALAEAAETSPAQTSLLVEAVDKRDEITTCALWVQRELASAAAAGSNSAHCRGGARSLSRAPRDREGLSPDTCAGGSCRWDARLARFPTNFLSAFR